VTVPWDSSPLFRTVPAEALHELAGHAVLRHYDEGAEYVWPVTPLPACTSWRRGLLYVIRPADDALLVRQRPGGCAR
jgi:hypothetical protein